MGKMLNIDDFIRKSESRWGVGKFDYSCSNYLGNKKPIRIICKKHNIEFTQTPDRHYVSIGCPLCNEECYGKRKHGYWTYQRCYKVAKNYEWVNDFQKEEHSAYVKSINKGWIQDYYWLKRNYDIDENILSGRKHIVYKFEFTEFNTVYIGLTVNLRKRLIEHNRKGSVFTYCQKMGIPVPSPQIIESGLTLEESTEREKYWIEYYKRNGYDLLNKTNGGDSVGTLVSVNKERRKQDFIRKSNVIHQFKYDYSSVKYKNQHTYVDIICHIHGVFTQLPMVHLRGQGCKSCLREQKI